MSQIFDALHKSESERSGTDPAKLSAAADLLEAAERHVVQFATDSERPTDDKLQAENDHPSDKVREDQFSQFQPVRVLVPPQSKLVCITEEESLAAEKFRFLGVRLRQIGRAHV